MDAPCETCGSVRCQRDKKFFIDLPNDFLTRTVIPCGARRDLLEKFKVPVDATITFQCTLMKMLTVFNCLVTNDANRTYFGFPGWKALANVYEMEAGERATFFLD
ncbi:hypothetical protein VPH35_059086 [Triticum aestivum]